MRHSSCRHSFVSHAHSDAPASSFEPAEGAEERLKERMIFLPGMVERTIPGKPRPAKPEGVPKDPVCREAADNTDPGVRDYFAQSAMQCEEFSPRILSKHAHTLKCFSPHRLAPLCASAASSERSEWA